MLCRKCQKYGHTDKRCNNTEINCRRCSAPGRTSQDCTSEETKCTHCSEHHLAGDRQCPRQKNEQVILDLVDQEKVTFQRAQQMLQNNFEAPNQKPKYIFPTHFDVIYAIEHRRKISPFLSEKCIQNHTGTKPRTIRTKDATTFIIEISSHKESVAMTILDKIHNYPVQTAINKTSHIQKGLLYVYGYESSFQVFKTGFWTSLI